MINIFKSQFKRNLLTNSLTIFIGDTMTSLILMLSTIIVINHIGFKQYGIITLCLTYINIINILFNFQSYNAIIKFGHEAIEENNILLQINYFKQAFIQDFFASFSSFIVAFIFYFSIRNIFLWDSTLCKCVFILMFTLPFNIIGSIYGILRLYNKYVTISLINCFSAIIKIFLTLIGVFFNLNFEYFIYVELLSIILSNLIKYSLCVKLLVEKKMLNLLISKVAFNKKFFNFNIINNLVTTLDVPVGELTKIFISKYLGLSDVGVYNLLQKIGNIIFRITGPITIVLYPELTRFIARKENRVAIKLTVRITKILLMLGLVFIFVQSLFYPLWGPKLFKNLINQRLVTTYFIYIIFCATTSCIHQIFTALDYVKYNIYIVLFVNIGYLLLTPYQIRKYGLFGLFISLLLQAFIVIFVKILIIYFKRSSIKLQNC